MNKFYIVLKTFLRFQSLYAIRFVPALNNRLALANNIPLLANSINNTLSKASLAQLLQNQSPSDQVFNLIPCVGNSYFIESSTNPYVVLQGGPVGSPITAGYRVPQGVYPNQLFKLDGPFIR